MEEARHIQQRLLPAELPQLSGCDLQAFWQPAKEVGGDYFDAIRLTESTAAICIADVAGKGLPAALLMSHMQASVRGLAHSVKGSAEMCRQLNRVALQNARSERFTTFFYGILDSTRAFLLYSNAGHVPPILIRRDATISRLTEGGTVLGVFSDAKYEESEIAFGPGDRLVLVTDGITEAANNHGEEFGEDKLIRWLIDHRHLPAADLQRRLVEAVAEFADKPLQDDTTFMIISKQCILPKS